MDNNDSNTIHITFISLNNKLIWKIVLVHIQVKQYRTNCHRNQ